MNEAVEINIDDKTYTGVLSTSLNNKTYYYMVNNNNPKDVCLRKVFTQDNEEFLIELDNEEELTNVLIEFIKMLDL